MFTKTHRRILVNEFYRIKNSANNLYRIQHGGCDLSKLISGKNVLIIGPTLSEATGDFSYDYDLIVRCNNSIEHIGLSGQDGVGDGIDLLYLSPSSEGRYFDHIDIMENNIPGQKYEVQKQTDIWERFDGKLRVVRLYGGVTPRIGGGEPIGSFYRPNTDCANAFFSKNNYSIRAYHSPVVPSYIHRCMRYASGAMLIPRCGFLAVVESLLSGANSVYIKNMTFYHGGSNVYRSGSVESFSPTSDNFGNETRWHDSSVEIKLLKFFINLCEDGVLQYDDAFGAILNAE